MRAKEFTQEASQMGPNTVHRVEWDYPTLMRNLAAVSFMTQKPRVSDAIVYLGLMGDPDSYLELKRKAVIGGYNPKLDNNNTKGPWYDAKLGPNSKVGGEFFSPGNPNKPQAMGTSYDIIIRVEDDTDIKALQNIGSAGSIAGTAMHELRHRGFEVTRNIPALFSQMPKIFQDYSTESIDDPKHPYYTDKCGWMEHCLLFVNEDAAAHMFDPERRKRWQALYDQCEAVARNWLNSSKVPRAGWDKFKSEVQSQMPKDEKAVFKPNDQGALTIFGIPIPFTGPSQPASPNDSFDFNKTFKSWMDKKRR
jgi:hypothetical protein